MKRIRLHGDLATKFGAEWNLDVRSPAEALRAIQANRPGLLAHIMESDKQGVGYRIIAGERDLDEAGLVSPFGRETLHIVPVIGGAKKGGLGMIILGAAVIFMTMGNATVLIAGASGTGAGAVTVASLGFNIGVGLILGGISQMLVKTPQAPAAQDRPEDKPSHFFSGPVNSGRQGSAIPVGYGRLLVGSIPISGGFTTENMI